MGMKQKHHAKIVGILAVLVLVSAVLLMDVLSAKKELQSQLGTISEIQEETETRKEEIRIYLPETCYAAVGVPIEIYNSQITDQGSDISRYNVLWSCDIGENLERKYSLNATEEMLGEHALKVSVYDNALNLLAEKTCKLKVVDGADFEEITIHQVENPDDFLAEEITGDAVTIFLQADNAEDAEANIKRIAESIEKIRSADLKIPIYVENAFYKEVSDQETFQVMTELEEKLKGYENVYLVPVGIGIDCAYNYDTSTGRINEAGEAQSADLLKAVICGTMN